MKNTTRYPRDWQWPGDAKICVSVNMAFEDFLRASQVTLEKTSNKIDHFSLSYSDYGWKSGVYRILDLLDEVGIKASVSTNGLAAERHPEIVRLVADAGHEVNAHAWANDQLMRDDDPDAELAEIRRCTQVLTQATGGTRPVGWVSPGSAGSANTLGFLKAEGYLWNGDDASDDLPFLKDTPHGPMVITPRVNIFHNDYAMWIQGKNPPQVIWDGFKDTFDELYREGERGSPKWTELTLHFHMAGRPTLIPTVRKCLQYARQHEGVWFARKRDIAEHALKRLGGAKA
ncbi:polysaccharide deacetylase family protein [Ramlibacter sp. AW1]|uniref:Polysaccharide deacetylase family protein n=1 Tax=Ramlibacter aurantiacus TaxID=2801330 RepID=A0A936ZL92_9BURK|nr:polysaccharide deacetylase family protein [Ramlibacter aurantiacus]MBL0422952.1 polysaccharide deacetylase family protein [Ramlibacter aurantiacus]